MHDELKVLSPDEVRALTVEEFQSVRDMVAKVNTELAARGHEDVVPILFGTIRCNARAVRALLGVVGRVGWVVTYLPQDSDRDSQLVLTRHAAPLPPPAA